MSIGSAGLPMLVTVALLVAPPAVAAEPSAATAAQELLNVDRQFSSDASGKTVIDSIGAMLADDVRMAKPDGTFAKSKAEVVSTLKTNPNNLTGSAQWSPVRVGISGDGLHGFTYGFMTLRNAGMPDRRAKYLAYWIKQPAGWRVAAYRRVPSADGTVSTTLRPPAIPLAAQRKPASAAQTANYRDGIIAREKAFSDRAQVVGLSQAFREFGSADAMNLGSGSDFTYGNATIADNMPKDVPSPVQWAADDGAIAAAPGDLGVTFGFIRTSEPASSIPYFTIWRRASPTAEWLYVAE